jgi:hypothetical protein
MRFPIVAFRFPGRQRFSTQCLKPALLLDAPQAPLLKINLQSLLSYFALQLRNPTFRPARFAFAGKRIAGIFQMLPSPTMPKCSG